jgi:hypothetical protein
MRKYSSNSATVSGISKAVPYTFTHDNIQNYLCCDLTAARSVSQNSFLTTASQKAFVTARRTGRNQDLETPGAPLISQGISVA